MMAFLKKLRKDTRGNVLVIMGAATPVLIGATGIAVDTIQWVLIKRQLQRAADSAAIAGVYQELQDSSDAGLNAAIAKDLSLNNHVKQALITGYPKITKPADSGSLKKQVKVELRINAPLFFSSVFVKSSPQIIANATAATTGLPDDFCVISLEPTTYTGLYFSGSGSVNMDCAFITNSRSKNSAIAKGSSQVYAKAIASVGGIQQSSNWHVGAYMPYTLVQEDPFKDVKPDTSKMSPCAPGNVLSGHKNGVTKGPGCYSSMSVGANETLTLTAGEYYINGGSVDIKGKVTGTNAVIILTNADPSPTAPIGSFGMEAQAELNLTAPTTGDFAGIAIYQDRRAPTDNTAYDPGVDYGGNLPNNSPNKINGGSSGIINGAIYFPRQRVVYNGNGSTAATCTQFVVRQIIFNGNNSTTNITSDCPLLNMDKFKGVQRVRLVA